MTLEEHFVFFFVIIIFGDDMKDLAIAIRNYNRDNYKDIINSIKKVGFKNVFIEWYDNDLLLQEDILKYVRDVGLNVIFAHLGYQNANLLWKESNEGENELNRYINDIKTCKENGIDLVIIHPTYEYDDPGMNEIGLIRIKKILDFAKELDIKVAFENVELVKYLEYIIKNINSSNLGICFDVGHCNLFCDGKFNVELFKNMVYMIHLHDNFKERDDHNLPFDGTVDWEKALNQIIDMNYDGYVVIESGYNNFYSNLSLEEYYKQAYTRGLQIKEILDKYRNN